MPSPLNGLMAPPSSAMTSQVGPVLGVTDPPVGSLPPVGGPQAVSGEMPQRDGAVATNASISLLVFTDFQPWKVERRPTPTLTVPSPTGNTQPYPGRWLPSRSRRSRWLSIQGSSWN